MSRAALVILNPVSGKSRALRLWRRIRRGLEVRFPHLVVYETTTRGDAGRRAAEWTRSGETGAIIVLGGDGTLHEVANALAAAGSAGPLGVIPTGTGNDFARNAGISLDPDVAAGQIAADPGRLLDLGRLWFREREGEERSVLFLNSVSVGVSPAANRHAKWLGYMAGGVLALLTEPRRRFIVTEAGRTIHDGKAINITVANGPAFGGGMQISPDSSPWDGVVERVIIGPVGLVRALLAFRRIKQGAHVGMHHVTVTKTSAETMIESDAAFHVEADGEDFLVEGRVIVSVAPGALRVLGSGS